MLLAINRVLFFDKLASCTSVYVYAEVERRNSEDRDREKIKEDRQTDKQTDR